MFSYKNLQLALLTLCCLFCGHKAEALLLSDFNNLSAQNPSFSRSWTAADEAGQIPQYTQNSGFITIEPVALPILGGFGNPLDDGDLSAGFPGFPLDLTGLTTISLRARINAGNAATSFLVVLLDSTPATNFAIATFNVSSFSSTFSTVNATLVYESSFDPSQVAGWALAGGTLATPVNFRMSFDNLELLSIPEPSTNALFVFSALVLLGTMHIKRQRA
jgi:hypothetical protein